MKKARITLSKGIKSWSFFIYDSSESAFYLKELPDDEPFDEEYRRQVTIDRSDIVEIEWLGSEWVYHEELDKSEKYDKVRLAKLIVRGVGSRSMGYVEIYSGWLGGGVIDWTGALHKVIERPIKVTPIKGRMKHKLDFSRIFLEDPDIDEEASTSPVDLN